MSTNYYVTVKADLMSRLNGIPDEVLHIGKSSGGWCFSLHVIPERGITCLRDWYRVLHRTRNSIVNEYDKPVTLEDILDIITNRSIPHANVAFLVENYPSLRDSKTGLRRHGNCYGHGVGTWDLIEGDFS